MSNQHIRSTTRDLRLFAAVYEERSFTAAASRQHTTQSGISQHIRNLEDRLGVRLFTREKGGRISPTPAGHTYYPHAVAVLRAQAEADAAVRPFASGLSGRAVLGLPPSVSRRALAPALLSCLTSHPNLSIEVVEGYTAALAERVQAGDVDFAIVSSSLKTAGITSRFLLSSAAVLVSGAASPLRHGEPVDMAAISDLKLILPKKSSIRRQVVEDYLARKGAGNVKTLNLDAMFGALDLVACSDWLIILPAIMYSDRDRSVLKCSPIVNPEMTIDFSVVHASDRPLSPVAEVALEYLTDELHALNVSATSMEPRAADAPHGVFGGGHQES